MNKNKRCTLLNILASVAVIVAFVGCETTNSASSAMSQKEMNLKQAGFKTKTLTTPQQQQDVAKLPAARVSMVRYHGIVYYVYPTSTKNQVLVGKKPQYQTYKNMMVQAQRAAATQGQPTVQSTGNTALPINIDPDPRHVAVDVYYGMGPMDDGSSW